MLHLPWQRVLPKRIDRQSEIDHINDLATRFIERADELIEAVEDFFKESDTTVGNISNAEIADYTREDGGIIPSLKTTIRMARKGMFNFRHSYQDRCRLMEELEEEPDDSHLDKRD